MSSGIHLTTNLLGDWVKLEDNMYGPRWHISLANSRIGLPIAIIQEDVRANNHRFYNYAIYYDITGTRYKDALPSLPHGSLEDAQRTCESHLMLEGWRIRRVEMEYAKTLCPPGFMPFKI